MLCQVNAAAALRRCDSSVSQLSWLRHTSSAAVAAGVHHITCLDNLCFPYADDSTATTPTVDVIFGGSALVVTPYYNAIRRRSSARSAANFICRQDATSTQLSRAPSTTLRPGFTFIRNRREPTHFQWFGTVAPGKLASTQLLQLPGTALARLVSPSHC